MLRRVPPYEACGRPRLRAVTHFGVQARASAREGSTVIGSPEFDGKRFGPKVLQENHPCGPGHMFPGLLIFPHFLKGYVESN
jgi:hypothetical protein